MLFLNQFLRCQINGLLRGGGVIRAIKIDYQLKSCSSASLKFWPKLSSRKFASPKYKLCDLLYK